MGGHNTESNDVTNDNLEAKLDQILRKLDLESKKSDDHFLVIKNKLDALESRTNQIEQKVTAMDEQMTTIAGAVGELDVELNILQQERLSKNILITGVPIKEKSNDELRAFFCEVLASLTDSVTIDMVSYIGRFGSSEGKNSRSILVKFSSVEAKERAMAAKKKKDLTCAMFGGSEVSTSSTIWGTTEDTIYFSDHMTPANSQLNREARKLKADKKVQFVWTVNGTTYIRKSKGGKSVKIHTNDDIEMVMNGFESAPRRSQRRKLLSPEKVVPESKRDKPTDSVI